MTAPIESIVHVTINTGQLAVEQSNFGTPLIVDYFPTARFATRVKSYASYSCLADLLTDGFTVNSPVYKMASAVLQQEPRVESILVGRLALPYTQSVKLTVTSNTEGDRVGITIIGLDGTEHEAYHTVTAGQTLTQVCAALEALIDAHSLAIGTTQSVAELTCTNTNAGALFYYYANENVAIEDITTDPGIATDMAAILTADDDWYHVIPAESSNAIADALATWGATTRKFVVVQSQDSAIPTSAITDIATELSDDSRTRCAIVYHHAPDAPLSEYPACAISGVELPKDPGSYTLKFKTLAGVTPNVLTSTQIGYLVDKRCNYYIDVANVNMLAEGVCSGEQWIDVARLADYVQARVEEEVFTVLASSDKVPYTDAGIDQLRAAIWTAFSQAADLGGLEVSSFVFTATPAASQTTVDRAARTIRGLRFGAVLTGACHSVYVTGDLE